jgi:hypothetical protein
MFSEWSSPLLFVTALSLLIYFMQTFFEHQLKLWGFTLRRTDIKVDEDLPKFWDVLKIEHAD